MKFLTYTFIIPRISGETVSCNGSGVQAIPNRCTDFVNCDRGSGVVQTCGTGTVFHKVSLKINGAFPL